MKTAQRFGSPVLLRAQPASGSLHHGNALCGHVGIDHISQGGVTCCRPFPSVLRQRVLVEEFVDMAQHVVGDDRMAFGPGVEGATVERRIDRLQVSNGEMPSRWVLAARKVSFGLRASRQ
jgi:hypothetical protein